jgi:hypothetical protein
VVGLFIVEVSFAVVAEVEVEAMSPARSALGRRVALYHSTV